MTPEPAWKHEDRQRVIATYRPGTDDRACAQQALADWLGETVRPDLFVTLRFNESLSPIATRRRLRVFGAMVERNWLGQYWWKKPDRERSLYVAFLEGTEQPHWHMLWRLPVSVQHTPLWKLQALLPAIARRKIAPAGSVDVQDLRPNGELLRVITYCLKQSDGQHNDDRFVISTEFRSANGREK
ncbi:MAG TPA: hypothetical protein VGQ49_16745 [Bryobacteraceae bacterium]|jgi:hypothetical protein|nr:hypothetical protein [Bryobacteraceae bacterium]